VYFDEEIVWKVATQVVLALAECHKHKDGVVSCNTIKEFLLEINVNTVAAEFGCYSVDIDLQ
jgi:hypothetical protein